MRCTVLLLVALTTINGEEGQLETLVGEQTDYSGKSLNDQTDFDPILQAH